MEGEELPLAAKKEPRLVQGEGLAIRSCCELPKNGSGEGRGVAVAIFGKLPVIG